MKKDYECPLCEESLVLVKNGVMRNKTTNEIIYVYVCSECNQAFALDNDEQLKLIPYNARMEKIENKCKVCGKIENYNEKGLFMLNIDTAYYEFYCMDCAKNILQEWAKVNCKKNVKVSNNNIHQIYELYDFNKNNEMMQQLNENTKKYKDTLNKVKKGLEQPQKQEQEK